MEINLNTARDICSIIQTNKSKTIQFKIIVILNQFKNYLVDLEWRKRSKLSNRINEKLDARAWQVHLHRGSFILDRRGEKVEACPNSKFDPCCAIPSFPPPDFRFFSGRGGRQSRGDSCARAHLEERRIMQPRMSRGRAHTPSSLIMEATRGCGACNA